MRGGKKQYKEDTKAFLTKCCWLFGVRAAQTCANLVELEKMLEINVDSQNRLRYYRERALQSTITDQCKHILLFLWSSTSFVLLPGVVIFFGGDQILLPREQTRLPSALPMNRYNTWEVIFDEILISNTGIKHLLTPEIFDDFFQTLAYSLTHFTILLTTLSFNYRRDFRWFWWNLIEFSQIFEIMQKTLQKIVSIFLVLNSISIIITFSTY